VFSVFNYGVRILVDHTDSKAVKGGFAVSGYDYTKAGGTVNLMSVTPDSIRFNINNSSTKALKGGFAVGSFADTKGPINEDFLYITPQNSESGQYNTLMGYQTGHSHTSAAEYNSFLGYQAGYSNLYGDYNTFLGYQAGYLHEGYNVAGNVGRSNIYIGHHSAYTAKRGTENCIIGYEAGMYASNGSTGADLTGNTFMGYRAGKRSSGSGNLILGHSAGFDAQYYNTKTSTGSYNIILGNKSGGGYTSASDNVLIGVSSGFHLSSGNSNVAIGTWTGYELRSSSSNVIIGYMAGQKLGSNQPTANNNNVLLGYNSGNLLIGSGNVFIGNETGRDLTLVSNKLYIDNAANDVPLIYGDFATRRIGFGTNAPGHKLDVRETVTNGFVASVSNNGNTSTSHGMRIIGGNSSSTGATFIRFEKGVYGSSTVIGSIYHDGTSTVAYATSSDERIKRDINQTSHGLSDLMKIVVYDFSFKFDETNSRHTGFLAQQLYDIFPAAVCKPQDEEELWMVDYSKVSPLVVKAIQEQQVIIEAQNDKIARLEKLVEQLLESR
jgi:hypothetical protein